MTDERVLVIKLSALGDFIQATGPFKAIRAHHRDARITLLTTAPFAALGEACGWFDEVLVDHKPTWRQPGAWIALIRMIARRRFHRVYDLQHKDRQALLFAALRLIGQRPDWSGVARGASHRHVNPLRETLHTLEKTADQLRQAGISETPFTDLDWMKGDLDGFDLPERHVLLIPGAAVHRPEKRWPTDHYTALARALLARGLTPILLGGPAEVDDLASVARAVPGTVDLVGRTDLPQIASLARGAVCAVGNDTGPMHIVAAVGCPCLVLFGPASDPRLTAPRGPRAAVLEVPDLPALPPDQVLVALAERAGIAELASRTAAC